LLEMVRRRDRRVCVSVNGGLVVLEIINHPARERVLRIAVLEC
jgi:hypothetical protein